jgi:hypothetical protein
VNAGEKCETEGKRTRVEVLRAMWGLWLRPVGGGQIYCGICARAMAELPPPSTEVRRPRRTVKNNFELEDDFEGYRVSEIDFDDAGGVA